MDLAAASPPAHAYHQKSPRMYHESSVNEDQLSTGDGRYYQGRLLYRIQMDDVLSHVNPKLPPESEEMKALLSSSSGRRGSQANSEDNKSFYYKITAIGDPPPVHISGSKCIQAKVLYRSHWVLRPQNGFHGRSKSYGILPHFHHPPPSSSESPSPPLSVHSESSSWRRGKYQRSSEQPYTVRLRELNSPSPPLDYRAKVRTIPLTKDSSFFHDTDKIERVGDCDSLDSKTIQNLLSSFPSVHPDETTLTPLIVSHGTNPKVKSKVKDKTKLSRRRNKKSGKEGRKRRGRMGKATHFLSEFFISFMEMF